MKEIVIIHHEPLTKKIKRNFFIDELISKGIVVMYIDVHYVLFEKLSLIDEIQTDYSFSVKNINQIKELIFKHRNALFILEFDLTVKSFWILRYLTKNNCLMSSFGIHSSINLSLKEKIMNIHNYGIGKLLPFAINFINKLAVKLLKIFYPIKNIDIAFYCGSSSFDKYKNVNIKVPINSFDFEDFIAVGSHSCENSLVSDKYAVFLDEYLPYHPDVKIWGKQALKPDEYFKCLNKLFDEIERVLSIKVVIALHPKADYSTNIFLNRATFKYKTAELVRDCEFVIAHDSLSISFAILNSKPILFTYMSDFFKMGTTIMVLLKKFSKMLDCTLLRMDQDFSINEVPRFSESGYLNYKYKYLTNENSENVKNVDILNSFITSYCYK
ncbi:MAG: hypothetical protein VB075_13945 [Petrimonas sp.]|uniref:hypothetical protein n=1 Tax=Petrimonas sp. TaxID=2023866 RepID=UPI002B3819D7|nr:hypothetical protein [Petrimonas sp.]MEA5045652.1 hypothetical protein [Petrimonas sp.]